MGTRKKSLAASVVVAAVLSVGQSAVVPSCRVVAAGMWQVLLQTVCVLPSAINIHSTGQGVLHEHGSGDTVAVKSFSCSFVSGKNKTQEKRNEFEKLLTWPRCEMQHFAQPGPERICQPRIDDTRSPAFQWPKVRHAALASLQEMNRLNRRTVR